MYVHVCDLQMTVCLPTLYISHFTNFGVQSLMFFLLIMYVHLYYYIHVYCQETQGVAVATYGESTDFPAFFTRSSGFKVHNHYLYIIACMYNYVYTHMHITQVYPASLRCVFEIFPQAPFNVQSATEAAEMISKQRISTSQSECFYDLFVVVCCCLQM